MFNNIVYIYSLSHTCVNKYIHIDVCTCTNIGICTHIDSCSYICMYTLTDMVKYNFICKYSFFIGPLQVGCHPKNCS